jgi:hypothetical protein
MRSCRTAYSSTHSLSARAQSKDRMARFSNKLWGGQVDDAMYFSLETKRFRRNICRTNSLELYNVCVLVLLFSLFHKSLYKITRKLLLCRVIVNIKYAIRFFRKKSITPSRTLHHQIKELNLIIKFKYIIFYYFIS